MSKPARKSPPAVLEVVTAQSGALTGDEARMQVACNACVQLENIFIGLRWQNPDTEDHDSGAMDPMILDAVALRGLALCRVVYGALQDDITKTTDLERVVSHG
jgi:hypothetical protein